MAKVKKQCAGDYFYGDDLKLEKQLQTFEGRYGEILKAILAPGYALTTDDAEFLKRFWRLQHSRTDASARTMVEESAQMDKDLGGLPPDYLVTLKEAVQIAMRIFFQTSDLVSDLGVRLVRNQTDRSFITSDDPAVMTNRWHLASSKADFLGAGLANAGMLGMLPLSPDVACILYDRDIYSIGHKAGWIEVHDVEDVDAINEQQALNCQANLYFEKWEARDEVAALVAERAAQRCPRYALNYAVFESETKGVTTYRGASAEEARTHERSMIHTSRLTPSPLGWPSIIRWRSGGSAYEMTNGTLVRAGSRTRGTPYRKVRVRP